MQAPSAGVESPSPGVESPAPQSAPTAAVSSSAVQQVLDEYQAAYSSENIEALKGLLAQTLVRENGNDPRESAQQAVATYEQQFSELSNPEYRLSGVKIEPGQGEASAGAVYTITSDNNSVPTTGSIGFHLIANGEQLLIDNITIEPAR